MIRVGGSNPHAYFETSHISVPEEYYAREQAKRTLSGSNMRKVSEVYVGSKHVYPEIFRYTLKYKMRLNFTFNGNSHGFMRPSYGEYAEAITTGYVEDIVRLDTVFPTYVGSQSLIAPEDYYSPHVASHPKYGYPPWGIAEQYRNYGGTEFLIIPACALYAAIPGSGQSSYGSWSYGTGVFQKYTDKRISCGSSVSVARMGYRYIMQRTVSSSTTHPAYSQWDADEREYSTSYMIRARKTVYPFRVPEAVYKGYYTNTAMRGTAIPISPRDKLDYAGYISLGLTYRPEGAAGQGGAFLLTDMSHYGSSNSILLGARSPTIYGYEVPGRLTSAYGEGYTVKAPMFSGHKHIDNYDSGWNVGRQDITSWEDPQMDSWAHTDLDGSFAILENNNPIFSSIAEYVHSYFG